MAEAIAGAKSEDGQRKGSGFDQVALEETAHKGFANGAFEESVEEGADLVDEFYPHEVAGTESAPVALADKVGRKAAQLVASGGKA